MKAHAALFLLVLSVAGAACSLVPQTVTNSADEAVAILQQGIDTLGQQSADWQQVVKDTSDKLIKAGQTTIANEVTNSGKAIVATAGIETRCTVDHLRERVREDLIRIKASITKEKVVLIPAVCGPTPDHIDMSLAPTRRSNLSVDGYNLDVAKLKLLLENTGAAPLDVTSALARTSPYLVTVNLGANGVPLSAKSSKLVLRWVDGNKDLSQVNIIQPPPTPPTPAPITVTALKFTYWTGDEDKDDRATDVGAKVFLANGEKVLDTTTQGTGDRDRIWPDESTHGPFTVKLTSAVALPQASPMKLIVWQKSGTHDPAWRFRVTIDAELSNGQTRRLLNEYDPSPYFNHKPGDKKWWTFDLRGLQNDLLQTQSIPLEISALGDGR